MVVSEVAGGADPLGGGADQQVQDGLLRHSDRGQQAGPVGTLQAVLLGSVATQVSGHVVRGTSDWVSMHADISTKTTINLSLTSSLHLKHLSMASNFC